MTRWRTNRERMAFPLWRGGRAERWDIDWVFHCCWVSQVVQCVFEGESVPLLGNLEISNQENSFLSLLMTLSSAAWLHCGEAGDHRIEWRQVGGSTTCTAVCATSTGSTTCTVPPVLEQPELPLLATTCASYPCFLLYTARSCLWSWAVNSGGWEPPWKGRELGSAKSRLWGGQDFLFDQDDVIGSWSRWGAGPAGRSMRWPESGVARLVHSSSLSFIIFLWNLKPPIILQMCFCRLRITQ